MKRLLLTLLIILTSSPAYSLVSYKVSPDYEIQVSMNVVVADTTPLTTKWHINVKVRDMLMKKYIKAWDKTTSDPADFDRSGSRELSAFTKDYDGYDLAYKVMIESVFKIAMQIQDAGLIPVIKYGKIDQIDNTGGSMFHRITEQPSGSWSSKRRYVYVKTFYPDYYIVSSISPVMSDNKTAVLSWITSFEINSIIGKEMSVWAASETNILNFDLTEPDTHTKSKFIIPSETWLEAQKAMFIQTHQLISKMIKNQPEILLEARFGDINFTNSDNVMMIDLRNGILPDGNLIANPVIPPLATPTQIAPSHGAEDQSMTGLVLSWNQVSGATRYYLQISKDGTEPGFAASHLKYTVTGTSHTIPVTLSATSYYYWRVRAEKLDDPDMTSGYSDARYFKTQ